MVPRIDDPVVLPQQFLAEYLEMAQNFSFT